MKVLERVEDAIEYAESMRRANLSIGLVPTMGALHRGHLSLVEQARRECDRVIVTIFVNPTQFGPGEDLSKYPKTLEADLEACRELGVDLVFCGRTEGEGAVYSEGFQTWVEVEKISKPLCGVYRPIHFRGVATVVTLLFEIFKPHRAYFGLKDFQQARLLERMALDLRMGIQVCLLPTVREDDGLAMSSRNRYLNPEERAEAVGLSRALHKARDAFEGGETSPEVLLNSFHEEVSKYPLLKVQYAEIRDAWTLEEVTEPVIHSLEQGVVLAASAFLGVTRLIDNVWLDPR